jgi:Fungal specific transcription factor domain
MLFARLAESDTKSETTRITNSGRSVYLGEPFSLAFVVQRVCSPSEADSTSNKMHYAIPDTVDEKARNLFYDHKKEREEFEFLRHRGMFDVPEKSVSDKLIHVYFDCMHPAWPIFDRDKFARLYEENMLSPLVCQIVYFLAVTLCDESLLHEAGFKSRYKARIAFYTRAKALYHADYERDKVTLVSALFLMGFWWGGPVDEKDTWHWLGDSIGLAQTMGMHRSSVSPIAIRILLLIEL